MLPTPKSSKQPLPFGISYYMLYAYFIFHSCLMSRPFHPPWFHHSKDNGWRGQSMKVQWLRLALSNRPNRAGVSHPSHEDGNSFRNAVFFLEYRTMDKVQNPVIPNEVPSYAVFSILLLRPFSQVHTLFSGLRSPNIPNQCSSLRLRDKCHIHTKQYCKESYG
jgi:hypothetical protein